MKKELLICFGIMFLLIGVGFIESKTNPCSEGQIYAVKTNGETNCLAQMDVEKWCNNACTSTSISTREESEKPYLILKHLSNISNIFGRKSQIHSYYQTLSDVCENLDEILEMMQEEDCSFWMNKGKQTKCSENEFDFLKECYVQGNLDKKSWGNLCEEDYECASEFCYEEKCYRGGRDAYYENQNKELKNKINELENQLNSQEQEENNSDNPNSITGSVIDDNSQKQNFFVRLWNKLFRKN